MAQWKTRVWNRENLGWMLVMVVSLLRVQAPHFSPSSKQKQLTMRWRADNEPLMAPCYTVAGKNQISIPISRTKFSSRDRLHFQTQTHYLVCKIALFRRTSEKWNWECVWNPAKIRSGEGTCYVHGFPDHFLLPLLLHIIISCMGSRNLLPWLAARPCCSRANQGRMCPSCHHHRLFCDSNPRLTMHKSVFLLLSHY